MRTLLPALRSLPSRRSPGLPPAAHEVEAAERARRRRAWQLRRTTHLALARRRRLLVAGLVAAAVATGLRIAAPEPPATVEVSVAASDLAAGSRLTADDLTTVRLPVGSAPQGLLAAADLVGRQVAGPVRAGEPVTDVRLVGTSLLAGLPTGVRAVGVPVAADALRLVAPGDRVDLLAGGGRSVDVLGSAGSLLPADVVARGVAVLAVLGVDPAAGGFLGGSGGAGGSSGTSLVVAADEPTARALAGAAAAGSLSVALRSP